jgi:hypothetical protein
MLCKCLLRVAAGQVWANTEQLNHLIDLISEVPSLRVLNSRGTSLLTPCEEQVVAFVAEGLSNPRLPPNSTAASTPSKNISFVSSKNSASPPVLSSSSLP